MDGVMAHGLEAFVGDGPQDFVLHGPNTFNDKL